MINTIILQAQVQYEINWALASSIIAYVLIVIFALSAIILGLKQLRNRRGYSSDQVKVYLQKYSEKSGISDEGTLYEVAEDYYIKNYLCYDEIIRFLLTSLTILGLLGTFIGLAAIVIPNFNEVSKSVSNGRFGDGQLDILFSNITGGFSTAFFTSIVGIITALAFSLLYNIYRKNIIAIRNDFYADVMPSIIKSIKKENSKYDPVEFYNEIQKFFLQGLNKFEDAVVKSHEKLNSWAESVISKHTDMVKEYISNNNKKIQMVTDELQKEYSALIKVSKDNLKVSQILESLVSKLDSFADVIRNYDTTYSNLLEKIDTFSQNFGDLFSELNTIVDTINQPSQLLSNLYSSIQEMVNSQNSIIEANREVFNSALGKIEAIMKDNSGSNQETAGNIKKALDEFTSTLSTVLSKEALNGVVEPYVSKLIIELNDITNKVLNTEESPVCILLASQLKQITGTIEELKTIEQAIQEKSNSTASLSSQIDKINRNLGGVFEKLTTRA